ncbi:MAG: hypothetical protein ACRENI_07675 [Gemmatimonadaceae bacterium]
MRQRNRAETLQPVLKQVEKDLDTKIATACHAEPARDETTAELQRLSDTLAEASQSARAAAALRRRIRESRLIAKAEAPDARPG